MKLHHPFSSAKFICRLAAVGASSMLAFTAINAGAQVIYFAGSDFSGNGNGFIDQINLASSTPTATSYATGLGGVEELAINGAGTIFAAQSYTSQTGIYEVAAGGR